MSAVDRCPTCKGPRKPSPDNTSFPFCSGRCKLADLSNWLEGRYCLETEPALLGDGVGEGLGDSADEPARPKLH